MAGGPVLVEAAPPTINVDNDSAHQALVQQLPHMAAFMSINDNPWLHSAILMEIQLAVVTTFALIPLLLLQSMGGAEPTSQGSSQDAKSNWWLQPRRVRLVAASAFCGTLLLAASPVAANFLGTVNGTCGAGVHVRSCAHVSCASYGVLPEGTVVNISCQASGDNVYSDVAWDFVLLGNLSVSDGYVTDYYLSTPYTYFAPYEPSC